jgi:hypothetical protein
MTPDTKFRYLCAYRIKLYHWHVTCSVGEAMMIVIGLTLAMLALVLFFWPEF